jgi:hypothetical protein
MVKRRLRVLKWLSTTPAVGVCTLCSQQFKVPMTALRRAADAQASLQKQFDRHKCEPDDTIRTAARVNADVLLRQEPDEEEEEEEDDPKEDDDDPDTDDGYSESLLVESVRVWFRVLLPESHHYFSMSK